MKNNGFTVFGNERDREAVLTILDYVSESLSFADKKVCAFIDGFEEGAEGDIFVVNASEKSKISTDKELFTFSESMGEGMVSAFNPQQREHSFSFEIMTDDFMGRAYLAKDSKFSMKQILVAFTALLAKGCEASKILSHINEFTKEKD